MKYEYTIINTESKQKQKQKKSEAKMNTNKNMNNLFFWFVSMFIRVTSHKLKKTTKRAF